jgi:hypothetical protein
MSYDELNKILSDIHFGSLKSPVSEITNGDSHIVVLDDSTKNSESTGEVVVCIGANYTQGKGNNSTRDFIEEGNKPMRDFLSRGFDDFASKKSAWVKNKHAPSEFQLEDSLKKGNFHLVITNFCPFHTKQSWQSNLESERADLLSFDDWKFKHLDQLYSELKKLNPLWIGHGLHSEIPCLFRQFQRRKDILRWLLMPNLSCWYNYKEWPFSKSEEERRGQ